MWLKAARLVAAVAPSDTWINQIVACAKTMLHEYNTQLRHILKLMRLYAAEAANTVQTIFVLNGILREIFERRYRGDKG